MKIFFTHDLRHLIGNCLSIARFDFQLSNLILHERANSSPPSTRYAKSYTSHMQRPQSKQSTMLQKLSKCEVKTWLCWNLIILPPLRFYVKSNLVSSNGTKMSFLPIFEVLNFDFSKLWTWKLLKFTKNHSEPLKWTKNNISGPFEFTKFDFT